MRAASTTGLGRVLFSGLPDGPQTVTAVAPGYDAWTYSELDAQLMTLRLRPTVGPADQVSVPLEIVGLDPTETDGFVAQILVKDGEQVETGRLLLVLEDPELLVEQDMMSRKLAGLQADHYAALLTNPLQAENVVEEIVQVRNQLHRVEERIEHLNIRAQMSGRLVMPRQDDLLGSMARRGDTLGYVLVSEQIRVRAALSEHDAALVRESTRSISVRLDDAPENEIQAQLIRDVPAATHDLPSRALGDRGGGPYATDPADENGLRTIEPVVLSDLKLPEAILQRVGGRAWVRYSHAATPIANQSYRLLRQLFLQHFNPAG